MDTRTRHALKQDKFAAATASSVSWLASNRSAAMPMIVSAAVVILLLIGGLIYWNVSSTHADSALGAALDTYDALLAQPGAPAEPAFFSTASERSKAANQQFAQVAKEYGWLPQGAKAHYFEGLTFQELGQNAQAETELKICGRFMGPQSRKPGQNCAGQPLSPDGTRQRGYRSLQRRGRQAV